MRMVDALHTKPRCRRADCEAKPARIFFDFTTSAMWTGPPVGIVRVETEFGRWGLDHLDRLVPVFFDPGRGFREISREAVRSLLAGDAAIDRLSLVSPARKGKRKTDRIPASLQPPILWIAQLRRKSLQALERLRLRTANARVALLVDALQRTIMNNKCRAMMVKADGSRRAHWPIDMVLGPAVDVASDDIVVCAGSSWTHNDISVMAELKRSRGFRFVVFCYDIIPLMFPQFYKAADVMAHRAYWERAFALADLIVFSSQAVKADVAEFCAARSIALGKTAVCRLGSQIPTSPDPRPLPAGLEPNQYALLVSTIEPRKGHRLIYDAWLTLLEAGVPQRARFKLVFAGRVGWMVGDLMQELRTDPRLQDTLMLITDADDPTIASLYRDAAFCLFPSVYEGYGLPVVEAFSFGKAVLASTGGAVPEVIDGFSPCLDPSKTEPWRVALQSWIEDPASRDAYEQRIRTAFRHPNWAEASQRFFAVVDEAERET
jgi:glycosyltransferase involved in cell wall biosynthesis